VPIRGQALFGPSAGLERAAAAVNAAGPPARLPSPAALAGPFADVLRATGEPGPLDGIEAETGALAAVLAELHAIFAAPDPAQAAYAGRIRDEVARDIDVARASTPGPDAAR